MSRSPAATRCSLRTLDDALALRDRLASAGHLVVVGAGFLGAEAAAAARHLGIRVMLLEPEAVPLARAVGPEVGQVLAQVHRDRGVDLRRGVTVAEATEHGVRLVGGEVVQADAVLVAVRSVPNTDWLAGSGLLIGDGVVCDQYCPAADDVYAAGDVTRRHHPRYGTSMRVEHRTNAAEQGVAAARNLLHPEARKPFAPVPYFWSDQHDLRIQAYGYLRGHDEVAVVDGGVAEHRFVVACRTGERLTGALAIGMPPKAIRQWRLAVAAQAAWRDAVGHRPRPAVSADDEARIATPKLLDAAPGDTAWAVTATLLCGAVATPVMGRLGDMYGKRRILLLGVALLVAGSATCALSDSLTQLLAGRVLQGLSSGVIPLGVSLMRDVLPAGKLTASTAVMVGSTGVGGALGLPTAAVIADSLDWRVLFWAAAAVGAAVAVLIVTLVPESTVRSGGRFDQAGAAGLAAGLVSLLVAVSKGAD